MQSLRRVLVSGVAFGFFSQIWIGLVAFAAIPYIVRHMGRDIYGIYALSGFVMGYFGFLELGLGGAATKYAAEAWGQGNRKLLAETISTATFMLAFCALAAVLAVGLCARWFVSGFLAVPEHFRDPAVWAIIISSVGFAFGILTGPAAGVLRSLGRFADLNIIAAVTATLQTASTVLLLSRGYSLSVVLCGIVIVQAASGVAQWALSLHLIPELKRWRWNPEVAWRLVRFGGWTSASGVLAPVLSNIEKIFLVRCSSFEQLTFYSVPASVTDRLGIVPSSFASVLFPSFSYLQGKDAARNQDLHDRGTAYVTLIYGFFAAFLIVLGKPFLAAWMGPEFAERSALILAILAAGGLINAAARPALNALLGMGKPHIPLYFYGFEIVFYVPTAYLMTKGWGLKGAALAWSLRVMLDAILLHAAVSFLLKESAVLYLKIAATLAAVLVFPAAILVVVRLSGSPILSPLSILAVVGAMAVYARGAWSWGLDDAARKEIMEFARLGK